MRKRVLVTVDRGETRVAILEAEGDPSPRGDTGDKKPTGGRRRGGAKASQKREELNGSHVAELYIERRGSRSIVGNIYKGKVDNVLPGLEAAFVDIGLDKNGFLHADDIVMPGVEVARRGRGGKGQRITELLKPGQGSGIREPFRRGTEPGHEDLVNGPKPVSSGALFTMPIRTETNRSLSRSAARTMERMTGMSSYSTPRPNAKVISFSVTMRTNCGE